MTAATGFLYDPLSLEHRTGPGHPERPERARAIVARLEASGLASELDRRTPEPAPSAALARVHTQAHLAFVERTCRAGFGILDAEDTTVSLGSWRAALGSAGAALEAVARVADGTWRNAFALCRPPGHHAERDAALGFCLLNNVAAAAAELAARGFARVAILDWDVHHGNGTQHLFEEHPGVFYASLHQSPHYPGTGAASERGRGQGLGTTLNVPLAAGTGDAEWLAALDERVLPALYDFAPEFVLVSAGFDAHAADPLSGTRLSTAAFAAMTERAAELAASSAGGRLVSVLEGGYDLGALADSVEVHVAELCRAAARGGPH